MTFVESVYQGMLMTSAAEWIAVLTGVMYVILAALRSNWCWSFAIISSGIYVYLCTIGQLYIESILQCFYVGMAFFGWITWSRMQQNTEAHDEVIGQHATNQEIKTWPVKFHVINIALSGVIAFFLGFMFDQFTDQQNPYADAFTTVFSLGATFMVVRKVLENWIYWIVIDIVSIYLYHQRGYTLTAVLYFVFTVIAVVGFFAWYKKYKMQST